MLPKPHYGASKRLPLSIALLALFLLLAPSAVAAETSAPYIVVFKDSVERPGNLARAQIEQRNGKLGFVYRHALKGYSADLSRGAVEALRRDPTVAYVERDARGGIAAQTTPTGINRIFAPTNGEIDIDGGDDKRVDVGVAVFDTGIDPDHPDLNVVSQVNCNGGEPPTCVAGGVDDHSHGTHVAGTIGALDNHYGVVGVAPGARLWSVKVLDNSGNGTVSEYIAGIDWVTARADQIEVASSSLRYFEDKNKAFDEAMQASIAAGIVHVTAAGNEDEPVNLLPGNHPDVITVSALEDYDGSAGEGNDPLAWFSNYGPLIEVAAPGVQILSTVPTGYATESGTSMATPHVAGAAALLASMSDPESAKHVEAIRSTIVKEGNLNWNDISEDGHKEPLLDVSDPVAFNPTLFEPSVTMPTVATNAATKLGKTEATLNASVNPNGHPTTYEFEYGTTTAYGSKAPTTFTKIGSGTSNVAVSETIKGLAPETTYHFRIVATNTGGTVFGEDRQFSTPVPGFPHGDEDPNHWQSVSLTVPGSAEQCVGGAPEPLCPFTVDQQWDWRVEMTGLETQERICHGYIDGRFGGSGLVILTDLSMTEVGWMPMCRDQKIENGPLFGLICKHIPTGEYWVKQRFDSNGSSYDIPAGETYGFVYGEDIEGEGGIQNIIFGEEYGWDYTRYTKYAEGGATVTWGHKTFWDIGNSESSVGPTAKANGGAGSCAWGVI